MLNQLSAAQDALLPWGRLIKEGDRVLSEGISAIVLVMIHLLIVLDVWLLVIGFLIEKIMDWAYNSKVIVIQKHSWIFYGLIPYLDPTRVVKVHFTLTFDWLEVILWLNDWVWA